MRGLARLGGTVVLGGLLAAANLTPATASSSEPRLSSDATGPLFAAGQLRPGVPVSRCVRLDWSRADGTTLGLSVDAEGDLAPYLDVVVETGAGGGYGGCGDVTPRTTRWTGTLADLEREHPHPADQLGLAAPGPTDGAATIRLTVEVRDVNEAQARTATADFTFALVTGTPDGPPGEDPDGGPTDRPTDPPTDRPTEPPSGPPTGPTEEPGPTDGPGPADPPTGGEPDDGPDGSGGPDAGEADGPDGDPSGGPTSGPTEGPADGPADGPDDDATATPGDDDGDDDGRVTIPLTPDGASEKGWFQALVDDVRDLVQGAVTAVNEAAGAAAAPVARAVAWTFWTLPVLLLFLLLQNRIDARDPKLAEAPAEAVPGAYFDETYGPRALHGDPS